MCFALHIRHPQVHVPAFLTATCQVCTVSLKAGLSTYNRFARGTLDAPDGEAAQADTGIMRVARQAPTSLTRRLVCQLQAQGQEKGEHAFDKRLAIAQELTIGGFVVKINGDGPIGAGLVSGISHGSPSGQMVGTTDDPRWG
jgi:hypothetical protein